MKAIYNMGTVKKTENQRKKHIEQMDSKEIQYLVRELQKLDLSRLYISKHLKDKDITFSRFEFIRVIQGKNLAGSIVEYNETPQFDGTIDYRVLLRSQEIKTVTFHGDNHRPFNAQANLCFVISLKKCNIITAYWNKANDNHFGIDWTRYDKNLQIIK